MEDIYEILRCPITQIGLRELQSLEIEQINKRIQQGEIVHRDGSCVKKTLVKGLISNDENYIYPIEDGVIVLLASLVFVIKGKSSASNLPTKLRTEKELIQSFYEQIGWQKNETGQFTDTQKFADRRSVLRPYQEKTALRLSKHLTGKGKYILDVGSGPVHHPEYLLGQEGYSLRVCVDLSFQALREAQSRLGKKGIYILADATTLPFKDNVMDAVVSLHTVYHIPADEQKNAIEEIYRVLKAGASAAIVYSWGNKSKFMKTVFNLLYSGRIIKKIIRKLRDVFTKEQGGGRDQKAKGPAKQQELYFHAHDYQYFKSKQWDYDLKILVWNSISTPFTRTFVRDNFMGRLILSLIYSVEICFPRWLGKWGQYPMFIIRKK